MTRQYAFPLAKDLIAHHLRHFGPATTRELVSATGKSRDAVRKAVNKLWEDRSIYIRDWPYTGQHRAALWALRTRADQQDEPKPPARPLSELKVEWGRRNKTLLKARRSVHASRGNPFAMLIR